MLEREAVTGLHTLAAHQAPNGQIPKFVQARNGLGRAREADFWYLGCIDATLWWLIAVEFLDRHRRPGGLKKRYARQIRLAIQWLLAQEHQRFFLLQQNEAERLGGHHARARVRAVHERALVSREASLSRASRAKQTRGQLQRTPSIRSPRASWSTDARGFCNEYVLRKARYRDLFLSFVNFSFFGDEGDAFGNVLAVLYD